MRITRELFFRKLLICTACKDRILRLSFICTNCFSRSSSGNFVNKVYQRCLKYISNIREKNHTAFLFCYVWMGLLALLTKGHLARCRRLKRDGPRHTTDVHSQRTYAGKHWSLQIPVSFISLFFLLCKPSCSKATLKCPLGFLLWCGDEMQCDAVPSKTNLFQQIDSKMKSFSSQPITL